MGNLRADIECILTATNVIDVLRKRFPTPPLNTFVKCSTGDILNPFHQLYHASFTARWTGRKTNTAISHDNAGDTVAKRGINFVVPAHLTVVMCMHIDPPGRNIGTLSIDRLPGLAVDIARADNKTIFNRHISVKT